MSPETGLTLGVLAERIDHERDIRERREESIKQALDKQAIEYERRLETLNHAHEAALEAQRSTVPREMFEAYVKDHATAKDVAERNILALLDKQQSEYDRRIAVLEVSNIETASRNAGRSGIQQWIAPNFGSLIAIVLGLITLYILFKPTPQ